MASFTFDKVDENNLTELNNAANQTMAGNGSMSPFKEGALFEPSGNFCYLVTNKGTDKQRYHVALEGKIAGVDTYLWASMFLKTGINENLEDVLPQGFNQVCRASNLTGMTNKQVGEFLVNKLKKPDGSYFKISAKRIAYKSLYDGKTVIRTLIQFDLKD